MKPDRPQIVQVEIDGLLYRSAVLEAHRGGADHKAVEAGEAGEVDVSNIFWGLGAQLLPMTRQALSMTARVSLKVQVGGQLTTVALPSLQFLLVLLGSQA